MTIVVCEKNVDEVEKLEENVKQKLNEHNLPINDLSIANVSKYPPVTRKQFEEWSHYWPLIFHDLIKYSYSFSIYVNSKNLLIKINSRNKEIKSSEQESFENFMKIVLNESSNGNVIIFSPV